MKTTSKPTLVILCATPWEAQGLAEALQLPPGGGRELWGLVLALQLTGVGQEKAGRAAAAWCAQRPACVISTGFAGALREDLRAGDLMIDAARSGAALADSAQDAASRLGLRAHRGAVWSGDRVLLTPAEKRKAAESGAWAAEMEGQAIFEACRAAGVPLLSVRSISDPFGRTLPKAVTRLDDSGAPGAGFWSALALRPQDWPRLALLFRDSRRARAQLARFWIPWIRDYSRTLIKEETQ